MSDYFLTGEQVARMLGISRRTAYRWADIGRIPPPWNWTAQALAPYRGMGRKVRQRNPNAVRYTIGRHSFNETRGKR